MPKAVRIHENGGPEVLRWDDVEIAAPATGEVRLRHTAIGFNYSDLNVRRGGFYLGSGQSFPIVLGNEAAGVVEALGPGVSGVKVGDRVAYAGMSGHFYEQTGAYAEYRNVPAERLVAIPEGVSDAEAAAVFMKGLTAASIIHRVFPPKPGDVILVHAAASGVGNILAQWARHLGATVIGTVGSPDKAAFLHSLGIEHAILYRDTDFVAAVKAIVPEGVAAVFDGVGKDTFIPSMDCTRPFGMLVNYGNASGHVPPFDLLLLSKKGSLSVCRPGLSIYSGHVPTMRSAAAEIFDLVRQGAIRIALNHTYPLAEAARAHRDVENRLTSGSVVLLP